MTAGFVFDVQHYAVHDGPGIRTVVFFKGCPLRCLWCCNPESQERGPELMHRARRCRACLACVAACPGGGARRGGAGPSFDRAPCGSCGRWPCVEACPTGALARVGEQVTAGDTLARIAADEAFYRNSGGGVTFSGGEPFLQPEFLEALLLGCRERRIHTAVQTCGAVPAARLLELEPLVDLFLYDVKVMDPLEHRRCTGASNELILENLDLLAARARGRIGLRVPLVPGCTDSQENLSAIASLAVRLGLPGVELMPYHELGRDKHENLGRAYELASTSPPAGERAGRAGIEAAVRLFAGKGLACEIGGE